MYVCMCAFTSCDTSFSDSFKEPVPEYFEYWTNTCQVGKIEYISPHTQMNGAPNLSAKNAIEFDLLIINPKSYRLLCKNDGTPCFKLQSPSLTYTEYTETFIDTTKIKIRAKLSDASEGETITITGCLWPENRSEFSETDLKSQSPDLFYTTTFVQNTPPDNVKNMNSSGEGDFYPGTGKRYHYLSFDLPDLEPKKNHGSRYEIKTYLRESDGELYYKGSETISLDDSDPGKRTYLYYSAAQEEELFYEYTVQVLGPHGLKAELLATDERLGVHELTEPTITILNELNGLRDENHFDCIEVASNDGTVSYNAQAAREEDTLTVTVDGATYPANGTISGIGPHTIVAKSSKDGSRPITVTKKIRIVKTPEEATFTFATNDTDTYFNNKTDGDGYEYLEVPLSSSTVGYTISPTEEGTTVSGTVDGTAFNETAESETGTLDVKGHTLTAVIHKQYCNDVTTTRKIMVAKTLEEPVYTFNPDLNGKTVGEFEYIEVASSEKASYTIKPSAADNGAKVSGSVGSTTFSVTAQKTGELSTGDYTFSVTVSKDYMTSRTFTRKIKVDAKLSKPSITFGTDFNGKKDAMDYRYIEVDNNSSKVTYNVTNTDSRGGTVSTVVTDMANSSTVSSANSGQLGVGKYKIEATVKKDGYTDVVAKEFIVIVPKLKEPTISFGKDFNGKGADSDGYLYIEVPNTSSTVSYTSSTTEDGVTVTTKIGGWAKSNSGNLTIGEHEIVVTASKGFQNDVSITKKVKVVQELKEPTYSFTPGLTDTVTDGFEWIEVPDGTTPVTYTITAASGCSMTVKNSYDNSTSNVSGNIHVNNLVSLAGTDSRNYTLTVTVKKPYQNDKTFTKKIKLVKALQKPEIHFYKESGFINEIYSSGTPECGDSYLLYDAYDVYLSSGGKLYYKVTSGSGETVTLKDKYNNTTLDSSSGELALGPHKLEISVSKTNYTTKTFPEDFVFVQGILDKPTFNSSNGSETTYSGTGYSSGDPWRYRFSYINSDNMNCSISPGNTGNTVTLKVDGSNKTYSSFTLSPGNNTSTHTLVVTQTRENCKPLVTEWYVNVMIKPITLTYKNSNAGSKGSLDIYIKGFGGAGNYDLYGTVYLSQGTSTSTLWGYGSSKYNIDADKWQSLNGDSDGRSASFTLYTTTETLTLKMDNMRRRNHEDKGSVTGEQERSLSQIKSGSGGWYDNESRTWTLYTGKKGNYAECRLTFDVSD